MSFSDLLSSGRGPGVIGTLLALLVLVGFGTLYIFVFDEGLQGGKKTIESVIREQAAAIESAREDIKISQARISEGERFKDQASELSDENAKVEAQKAQITEAEAAVEAAKQAKQDAKKKWDEYKAAYRESEWARAKNEKLGDITSISGTVYHDVVIREVNHMEVKITDSSGPKSIKMTEMPLVYQDRFQPDPKTAEDLIKEEGDTVDIHLKKVELSKARKLQSDKSEELKKQKTAALQAAADAKKAGDLVPVWDNKIAQQRAAISVEKNKPLSKAPAMEADLRAMEQSAIKNKASITTLQNQQQEANSKASALEREIAGLTTDIARIVKELQALQAAAGKK